MKLLLVISVLVSVANCGELFWGDATEITDNGLFSLQCQHDGKVSFLKTFFVNLISRIFSVRFFEFQLVPNCWFGRCTGATRMVRQCKPKICVHQVVKCVMQNRFFFTAMCFEFYAGNFTENNEASWKMTPIDEKNAITDHFKITDVGHGKYQLKSFSSGKCLQAQG